MTSLTQLVGQAENHHLSASRFVRLEHHRDPQSRQWFRLSQ
jgi:hypothetical protein